MRCRERERGERARDMWAERERERERETEREAEREAEREKTRKVSEETRQTFFLLIKYRNLSFPNVALNTERHG